MNDETNNRTPEEVQEIIDKQLADVPEKIKKEQVKRLNNGAKVGFAVVGAGGTGLSMSHAIAEILAKDVNCCPIVIAPDKLKGCKEMLDFPDKLGKETKAPHGSIKALSETILRDTTHEYEKLDTDMGGSPLNLKKLRSMNMTDEQIEAVLSSPVARMDGEDYEEYKSRRKLKKMLEKYKDRL